MVLSVFGQEYLSALKELSTNDLNRIKLLRDLAIENRHEAGNVVQALVQHIRTCPEAYRLPALYVVDIVLKTVKDKAVKDKYIPLLSVKLLEVFSYVWERARPDLRSKLRNLAGSWDGFVPKDLLKPILDLAESEPEHVSTAPVLQQSILPFQPQPMPVPASGQASMPVQAFTGVQQFGSTLMFAPQALSALMLSAQLQQPPVVPALMQSSVTSYAQPAMGAPLGVSAASGVPGQLASLIASSGLLPLRTATSSSGGSGGNVPQDPVHEAVEALFSSPAAVEAQRNLRDKQFVRRKCQSAMAHQSRAWFVRSEQWLEGTRDTSGATAAVAFGEEECDESTAALLLVEEDPAQPMCAVSGEAFERTYDPDTDKWYYEDAVVLDAQQAAAFGVMEGSIVKSSCLVGALPTGGISSLKNPANPANAMHTAMSTHGSSMGQEFVRNAQQHVSDASAAVLTTAATVSGCGKRPFEATMASGDPRLAAGMGLMPDVKRVRTIG